jgi:adenine-specific DNA-methyltransferase
MLIRKHEAKNEVRMSKQLDKLVALLKELFQLDQPDLDFGLYRIMHAKADEITRFLDKDLLPQVREAFSQYTTADKADLERELKKAIDQANGLGVDPESTTKVKELRKKIADESVDVAALEAEVYDHLYSFFRRYYHEGDFLAKRVYKPGVYAIPYEGEEVKLHWANRDQYYIKTSEYLRDYAFTLRPGDAKDPMRVHFRLADVAEGEHGNLKAANGRDRVFVLVAEDFITEQDGELVLNFQYRPSVMSDWPEDALREASAGAAKRPPTQKELLADAVRRILAVADPALKRWIDELSKAHVKTSGLNRYTARHTFDYFIHKDLGRFLRRELDFYIKNEVMHLDDLESESTARVEKYLSKIKVLRKIAHKLIDFLAQLEDFQRKLWLKRKLIVETHYCMTLDIVPEEFYPEIAANDAQRDEWVRLLAIGDITGNQLGDVPFTVPLTIEFLKSNPHMMIDTAYFTSSFVARLLHSIEFSSKCIGGTCIHAENFHALRMMERGYRARVRCIYIDPPYNTDAAPILYKNGYKASSWVSLLEDRLLAARPLLTNDGVLVAAIDDEQQRELSFLLSGAFDNNQLGTIVVRANPSGRPTQTGYSVSHEYLLFVGRTRSASIGRMPPTEQQMARFTERDENGVFEWRNLRREGSGSDRSDRPSMYYPIYIQGENLRIPDMEWSERADEWLIKEDPQPGETVVWPINEAGEQKRWRWEHASVTARKGELAVRKDRTGKDYIYAKRRPHEDGVVSVSSWFDAKYSATEHGTALLKKLFGRNPFTFPKSIYAVIDAIYIGGGYERDALVCDFFAGSGTTAHAVIELNRRDGGSRSYVLVDMGPHFDSVLLPRLKKVVYAQEWEDGKPISRGSGVSHLLKYVRLESYEDAINNLDLRRRDVQQSLLDKGDGQEADRLKEQYLLRYMLDVEARGSQSLLNVTGFSDPTAYKLKVKRPGSDESGEVNIDLLETFNWLIGLRVGHLAAPQSFQAAFRRDEERRLRLDGRLRQDEVGPWWFRTVDGVTPDGRKTLVIWRKLSGDAEQDNLVLDEWFTRQGYSTKDYEFDLIYVNGDNNLENLRQPDETWKVRLIEEDFHRLMFDVESV